MGKIIIFAIVTQSPMSEKEKKTNDEEKIIPRPEGYTIVKYAPGWVYISIFFGFYLCLFLGLNTNVFKNIDRFDWIVFVCVSLIFWIIGRKITEVKVNLKITDEGLEQTRLSGSKVYSEYRLIKWEEMKHYHLTGRTRDQDFLISVRNDLNFRISIPAFFTVFEKQKDNWENFSAFRNDFWGIAPEHDVHRAFFG